MKRSNRNWAALLVLAAAGLTAYGMLHAAGPNNAPPPAPPAPPAPAFDADLTRFQGLLIPDKEVALHAPIEGILKKLNVKEGDHVKQGDVLLVMDDRVQTARVAVAKLKAELTADLQRAKYAAAEAEISLEMVQKAFEKDAASDWEVRQAKLQLDQQNASVDSLNEQLEVAKAMLLYEQAGLDQCSLEAPFDGEVVEVATEEGATLRQEDPVLSLVALSQLRAELRLPVSAYGLLQVGKQYTLQAGVPVNAPITGTLQFVDPRIDPASQTFRCVFKVDNANHRLPSGVAVRLDEAQLRKAAEQ